MSEQEVLHMQTIVSMAMGEPQQQTLVRLEPALRGSYKRVWKEVRIPVMTAGSASNA